MKALVLEKKLELNLRDINLPTEIGPDDVNEYGMYIKFGCYKSSTEDET